MTNEIVWSEIAPSKPGIYWGIIRDDGELIPVQLDNIQKYHPVEIMCSDEIFPLTFVKLWGPRIIPPPKP